MKAIDLFAGLGGNSEGARQAGVSVVWAANHWQSAVEVHAANHPDTEHACQDLHQADWTQVPEHDLLMASPACQGHTRARGKERPHHDATRSTAWAVVSAAEMHRPPFLVVENVPEFAQWQLYPAWCAALSALGYSLSPMIMDAADLGVPQHRRRLFVVGTRSKHPVDLDLPRHDHLPAMSFVDFGAVRWSPIHRPGRSKNTLARIEAGRREHGDRFLTAYYGSERGGRCLGRPIGTITTRDRWAVINGDRMRMLTRDECRAAMGFPHDYQLPDSHKLAVHMLGNAVPPPMTREIITALRKAA
ncbi:MAG: DNA cytosine methyltransferase [Thiohalobacteraceae bacterium]